MEQEKNCLECAEPIKFAAKKCPHCGSYQSWTARLPINKSILALTVALVAVLGLVIPILKDALTPDNSDVSIKYINRADVSIPIIVSNKGNRPAIIGSGGTLQLFLIDAKKKPKEYILFLTAINASRG